MRFAPQITALADVIRDRLEEKTGQYSGVHLRLEADAQATIAQRGGMQVYWQQYLDAVHTAKFPPDAPVYLSSGLMGYAASGPVERFTQALRALGHRGPITYKEQLLSREALEELVPEQQAALDLAVLLPAERLVGRTWSSFSLFLQQMRAVHGRKSTDTVLAGGPIHPEAYFRLAP